MSSRRADTLFAVFDQTLVHRKSEVSVDCTHTCVNQVLGSNLRLARSDPEFLYAGRGYAWELNYMPGC